MKSTRLSSALSNRVRLLAILCLFAGVIALVKAAHTYSSGPPAPTASARVIEQKKAGRVIETELLTLRPTGFEPTEITRPTGEFILMVENSSGQTLNLHLSRMTGGRLHEAKVTRDEPDWNELLDLHPGSYLVTEASHPEWTCYINITAH